MQFAIIDVETTGGSPKSSKITEIAIFKHNGSEITDKFVTLVNPEMPIPEFIVRLTGINDQMVENAPKFYEIAKDLVEFTQDCVFVAHNVGFDYGMIRQEFRRLAYDYRRTHLCTVRASRYVLPGHESYSLGKLSRSLGIRINGRHRAEGDAQATAELFDLLCKTDKSGLKTFLQDDLNPKILNPNLDLEMLDEIPSKTGIYKFYNEFNQLIYIGKSKHIRKRIDQHLKNTKTLKGLQLIKEIQRIEYELTGSELIALLLESKLIKHHRPAYNTALKKHLFPYALIQYVDEKGFQHLTIVPSSKVSDTDVLTYFSSRRDATKYLDQLCELNDLCQKFCHLHTADSACFNYTIKKCRGACVSDEQSIDYNSRVSRATAQFQLSNESFFLIESGRAKGEKSIIYVENGLLRGFGHAPYYSSRHHPRTWKRFISMESDDRDTRSILSVYLRQNPGLNRVMLD